MKEKKLIIIGAGQTIDELFPIIKNLKTNINYKLFKILDDDKKFHKKNYKGIPIETDISKAKNIKIAILYLVSVLIKTKIIERKF